MLSCQFQLVCASTVWPSVVLATSYGLGAELVALEAPLCRGLLCLALSRNLTAGYGR